MVTQEMMCRINPGAAAFASSSGRMSLASAGSRTPNSTNMAAMAIISLTATARTLGHMKTMVVPKVTTAAW